MPMPDIPIPPHYDSMIAKVITTASSRKACIHRMSRALSEYMITGVKTTIPFQQAIMQNADFRRGQISHRLRRKAFAKRNSDGRSRDRIIRLGAKSCAQREARNIAC